MIQEYKRSICATCSYVSLCVLTTDKRNITSCSEYEHYKDRRGPIIGEDLVKAEYQPKLIPHKEQLILK